MTLLSATQFSQQLKHGSLVTACCTTNCTIDNSLSRYVINGQNNQLHSVLKEQETKPILHLNLTNSDASLYEVFWQATLNAE